MYDYMKALQKRFDRQTHQNWTPDQIAPKRNCGGTWMPRGAESFACWTRKTHCWLNPS